YHQLGLHEQGLRDRSEAIRLNPNLPEAWFARGSAYYLMGDYKKAHDDIQQAVRLRPGYQEAIDVLTKTEARLREQPTAKVESAPQPRVEPAIVAHVPPQPLPQPAAPLL